MFKSDSSYSTSTPGVSKRKSDTFYAVYQGETIRPNVKTVSIEGTQILNEGSYSTLSFITGPTELVR